MCTTMCIVFHLISLLDCNLNRQYIFHINIFSNFSVLEFAVFVSSQRAPDVTKKSQI